MHTGLKCGYDGQYHKCLNKLAGRAPSWGRFIQACTFHSIAHFRLSEKGCTTDDDSCSDEFLQSQNSAKVFWLAARESFGHQNSDSGNLHLVWQNGTPYFEYFRIWNETAQFCLQRMGRLEEETWHSKRVQSMICNIDCTDDRSANACRMLASLLPYFLQ